jgi:hypothetical protein
VAGFSEHGNEIIELSKRRVINFLTGLFSATQDGHFYVDL